MANEDSYALLDLKSKIGIGVRYFVTLGVVQTVA